MSVDYMSREQLRQILGTDPIAKYQGMRVLQIVKERDHLRLTTTDADLMGALVDLQQEPIDREALLQIFELVEIRSTNRRARARVRRYVCRCGRVFKTEADSIGCQHD